MKKLLRFCLLIFIILLMRAVALEAGSDESIFILKEIKVRPGDNLWNIAERYAPRGSNYQVFVSWLEDINDKKLALIYPGETILVPLDEGILKKE